MRSFLGRDHLTALLPSPLSSSCPSEDHLDVQGIEVFISSSSKTRIEVLFEGSTSKLPLFEAAVQPCSSPSLGSRRMQSEQFEACIYQSPSKLFFVP